METPIGLRSQGGVPVTRGSGLNKKMHRYPVSPTGVLQLVFFDLFKVSKIFFDLFKVSKMTIFNYGSFKVSKMTIFNYGSFKVSKMTIFNYDLFKVVIVV